MRKKIFVVDYNPVIIKQLVERRIPCLYGDIGDDEVLERLDFKSAKLVISTIPELAENILLIKHIKQVNKRALIFVTANQVEEQAQTWGDSGTRVLYLLMSAEVLGLIKT